MQAGSIEAQILRARWMRHIHTMSYIHISSNPGSWVRAHTCMHKNTCTWVDVKKLTQCSINPIGMRLAGRSESLLSSLMVPIALAKLYNTFALPHDFRCCIAATASSKKSPGRFILKFDATYDLNRSEIMCNSWLGVVSGERCNSGIICISLVDFLQLAYGGNNVLQLKLGTWISYKDNLVLCCDKHFLIRIQKGMPYMLTWSWENTCSYAVVGDAIRNKHSSRRPELRRLDGWPAVMMSLTPDIANYHLYLSFTPLPIGSRLQNTLFNHDIACIIELDLLKEYQDSEKGPTFFLIHWARGHQQHYWNSTTRDRDFFYPCVFLAFFAVS